MLEHLEDEHRLEDALAAGQTHDEMHAALCKQARPGRARRAAAAGGSPGAVARRRAQYCDKVPENPVLTENPDIVRVDNVPLKIKGPGIPDFPDEDDEDL